MYSRYKNRIDSSNLLAVRFLFFKELIGSQASKLASKNPPQFARRSFQQPQCPASNLSLGTSPNNRYREDYCQAPFSLHVSKPAGPDQWIFLQIRSPSSQSQGAQTHDGHGFQPRCSRITDKSSSISRSFRFASSLSIITLSNGSVPEYRTTRRPHP